MDGPKMLAEISEGSTPDEKTKFRTTDIALASVLICVGHKLIDIRACNDRSDGRSSRKTEFVFMKGDVHPDIVRYTNGEITVNAKALLDDFRSLKSVTMSKGIK